MLKWVHKVADAQEARNVYTKQPSDWKHMSRKLLSIKKTRKKAFQDSSKIFV